MNKKFYLPLLIALVALVAGCKKMAPLTSESFTVNPNPIEVVGGKVNATITGVFPEKYFNKKSIVTVTPSLVYETGKTEGQQYVYQGEKITGNNQTINYKAGDVVSMEVSFDYAPEMKKSSLVLEFVVSNEKGSKTYELPAVTVAEGIMATEQIANADKVTPAITPDAFQRIINEVRSADIMFLIQQANIRSNQLKSEELKALQGDILAADTTSNKELKGIEIASFASPDGGFDLNEKLAANREKNTMTYLNKQLKKDKITTDVLAKFTAEDWAGFQELVSASNIQDKELILRVLSMYKDPEQREKEIKNMSSTFKILAEEILPQLRYSRISASIDLIGKSDEEISSLMSSDPSQLSVEEMLYAATLTSDKNEQLSIYTTVTEQYSSDYRGFNNKGLASYELGDFAAAESAFAQAAKLNSSSAEVQMNLGLISLRNGNLEQAAASFGKAGAVKEVNEAIGVLYIKEGEYQKAVKAFGDNATDNAAVAQILVKDYAKASKTLGNVANPTAITSYLKAIVAARTNNEVDVNKNLNKAVAMDASLKAEAANDIEFAKYDIAAIVE